MEVRCPQCHHSIDLPQDASLSDIACPSCGSVFSLLGDGETVAYESAGTRTLGHFDLTEQIGAGAFAVVFKARDKELDRTVAVKIPRKGKLGPTETEQFLREARAAAQLRHPNIVSVHEVGRDEDTVYIVSDHIDGLTLADWLTGQQLTSREAAKLCAKIADALHHAHESGVIHRDLKPANIMLDANGEPHIMDFGLARRDAGEVTMTLEGKVMGTPAYMSPEQAKGEAHQADRRTDVYSSGVILFETLTSEKPFRGNVRMLLHQVINEDAPSPRRLNSTVSRDLETICLKCLEKDPRKRYGSAKELAEELRRFLGGEPIQARPITSLGRFWRWFKRNPVVSGLAAGLVVALVGGLAGVTWQWVRAESQWIRAERSAANEAAARRTADDARTKAEEEVKRRRRLLYVSDMNVAQQAWEAANVGRVLDLLDRHRPQPGQEDLRGFEWYYLWRLCQRSLMTPGLEHGSAVDSVAFSPDGKTLASGGTDGTVKLWDPATGQLRHTLTGRSIVNTSVAFSPDGKTLASGGRDNTIQLWDTTTGEQLRVLRGHSGAVRSVVFSPDGKTVGSGSEDRTVKLWNVATGELLYNLAGHTGGLSCVALSPDGSILVSAGWGDPVMLWHATTGELWATLESQAGEVCAVAFSHDGNTLASATTLGAIELWDMGTRQQPRALAGHEGRVRSLAFSPDGKTLASAGQSDNTVKLWDVATGELKDTLIGHASRLMSVTFSPDAKTLASGSEDTTVRLWEAEAREDRNSLQHKSRVTCLAFSPHDKTLASGNVDNTVRLWEVGTCALLHTFEGHTNQVRTVAFSPDGKTLASGGRDRTVRLWDVRTRQEWRLLEGHAGYVYSVVFSPDGKTLASAAADQTVKLWDTVTGDLRDTLVGHPAPVNAVAFSPNTTTLASGSGHVVKLWSLSTGQQQATLQGHRGRVQCVLFSPDGKTLASGGWDTTVRLWDVATGNVKSILKGHSDRVSSLAFSPDGKTVASAAWDWSVRLWDVTSGEQRAAFKGHTGDLSSVEFSPDGKTLATGSYDYTVRLWRTATQDESQELAALMSLENRVRTLADADPQQQAQTLADVSTHWAAKAREGLVQKDLFLATSTARRLEESGNYELAAEACRSFGEAIAEGKDPLLSDLANSWQLGSWENRGKLHSEENEWHEAVNSFTKAIVLAPNKSQLLLKRGRLYVRLSQWKEAAADHKRLVELKPADHTTWLRAAPLFVLADDLEGYREHCRGMLARFGQSDEAQVAARMSKACLLLPDGVESLETLLNTLEGALENDSAPDWLRRWGYVSLALAAHRAGDADKAIECICKAQQSPGPGDTGPATALVLCLTAMSQQRLGEPEKASQSLVQAGRLIAEYFSKLTAGEVGVGHDWLIAEILRQEAEQIIGTEETGSRANGAGQTDVIDSLADEPQ